MAGAPEGNINNKKWKTAKERKAACDAVCKHLSAGYSQSTFPDADWKTVEYYMKEYPIDFPSDRVTQAKREGGFLWEKIGMTGTIGKIKNFNASSWKFNMANRLGWKDKHDHTTNDKDIIMPILEIERDI